MDSEDKQISFGEENFNEEDIMNDNELGFDIVEEELNLNLDEEQKQDVIENREKMSTILKNHEESQKKLEAAAFNPIDVKNIENFSRIKDIAKSEKEKDTGRYNNIRFQHLIHPNNENYDDILLEELSYPVVPERLLPKKTDVAYERDGIPQLVSQINHKDSVISQKALIILSQMFYKPENVYLGFVEDVLNKVIRLVYDERTLVRQKVTEILYIYSTHVYGRQKLLEKLNILNTLSTRFYDENSIVRKNTYKTFLKLCEQQDGIDAVLSLYLFNRLVKLTDEERMNLKPIILEIIAKCIRYGKPKVMPATAIKLNIIVFLKNLLLSGDNSENVKIATSKCIQALCYYKEGKELAVKHGLLDILVQLMVISSQELKREAATALMWITLNCDAKKKINKDGIHSIIWMLSDDSDPSFQLSLIKILTNCAEDPVGREIVELNCANKLKRLSISSKSELILKASRIALSVIYWKPWTKYNFEEESKKFAFQI